MDETWRFPSTQQVPEIKIAYGSKRVKSREETESSKYFTAKGRKPNPLYLREEAFGGIAQRGATVYLLNRPAFLILRDYLSQGSSSTDQLQAFREVGLL
jgi:hypothetical protein